MSTANRRNSTVLEWIRNGWQFPGKPAQCDKGGAQMSDAIDSGVLGLWRRTVCHSRS